MTTEIDLNLSGDAFKAQFGTEERIEMLVKILRDIAECPIGQPFMPRIHAMNITHTPGELQSAIQRLEGIEAATVMHQMMRFIILKERAEEASADASMYIAHSNRLTDAAEVMGYMSMALEFARDNLKSGRVKDGVKVALSRYRQWCDKALGKPTNP